MLQWKLWFFEKKTCFKKVSLKTASYMATFKKTLLKNYPQKKTKIIPWNRFFKDPSLMSPVRWSFKMIQRKYPWFMVLWISCLKMFRLKVHSYKLSWVTIHVWWSFKTAFHKKSTFKSKLDGPQKKKKKHSLNIILRENPKSSFEKNSLKNQVWWSFEKSSLKWSVKKSFYINWLWEKLTFHRPLKKLYKIILIPI